MKLAFRALALEASIQRGAFLDRKEFRKEDNLKLHQDESNKCHGLFNCEITHGVSLQEHTTLLIQVPIAVSRQLLVAKLIVSLSKQATDCRLQQLRGCGVSAITMTDTV